MTVKVAGTTGPPDRGVSSTVTRPKPCLQCKQAHCEAPCSGRVPCTRCMRLQIVCKPVTRGRPLSLHKRKSEVLQEQLWKMQGRGGDDRDGGSGTGDGGAAQQLSAPSSGNNGPGGGVVSALSTGAAIGQQRPGTQGGIRNGHMDANTHTHTHTQLTAQQRRLHEVLSLQRQQKETTGVATRPPLSAAPPAPPLSPSSLTRQQLTASQAACSSRVAAVVPAHPLPTRPQQSTSPQSSWSPEPPLSSSAPSPSSSSSSSSSSLTVTPPRLMRLAGAPDAYVVPLLQAPTTPSLFPSESSSLLPPPPPPSSSSSSSRPPAAALASVVQPPLSTSTPPPPSTSPSTAIVDPASVWLLGPPSTLSSVRCSGPVTHTSSSSALLTSMDRSQQFTMWSQKDTQVPIRINGCQPQESQVAMVWPPRDFAGTIDQGLIDEAFKMAAYIVRSQGLLKPVRAAAIMKTWTSESYKQGRDVTRGLTGYVQRLVGIVPCLSIGPSEDDDPNTTPSELARLQSGDIEQLELPSFVQSLDDSASAVSGFVFYRGRFVMFANQLFADVYMTDDELNRFFRERAVLPTVAWARIVAKEYLSRFFTSMISFAFCPPYPGSEARIPIESVDRYGRRRQCIARVRYVLMKQGQYSCLVLSLAPAPRELPHSRTHPDTTTHTHTSAYASTAPPSCASATVTGQVASVCVADGDDHHLQPQQQQWLPPPQPAPGLCSPPPPLALTNNTHITVTNTWPENAAATAPHTHAPSTSPRTRSGALIAQHGHPSYGGPELSLGDFRQHHLPESASHDRAYDIHHNRRFPSSLPTHEPSATSVKSGRKRSERPWQQGDFNGGGASMSLPHPPASTTHAHTTHTNTQPQPPHTLTTCSQHSVVSRVCVSQPASVYAHVAANEAVGATEYVTEAETGRVGVYGWLSELMDESPSSPAPESPQWAWSEETSQAGSVYTCTETPVHAGVYSDLPQGSVHTHAYADVPMAHTRADIPAPHTHGYALTSVRQSGHGSSTIQSGFVGVEVIAGHTHTDAHLQTAEVQDSGSASSRGLPPQGDTHLLGYVTHSQGHVPAPPIITAELMNDIFA